MQFPRFDPLPMNNTANDREGSAPATLRGFGAGEDSYAAELGQLAGQLKAAKAVSHFIQFLLCSRANLPLP